MSKWKWKKIVKEKTHIASLKYLSFENSKREKTKHIIFNELKMRTYISENKHTSLTRVIFSIRSRTLDIKEWNPWKYTDVLCVKCDEIETMDHFVICKSYGETLELLWTDIYSESIEKQIEIGRFVQKRHKIRQDFISQQEDGQASTSGSTAPGTL